MTLNAPAECRACGKPLLLANLLVDDGCPCNSPRGVNFAPQPCALCKTEECVKPAHRLEADAVARLIQWAEASNSMSVSVAVGWAARMVYGHD